jgi:hypothetical protein
MNFTSIAKRLPGLLPDPLSCHGINQTLKEQNMTPITKPLATWRAALTDLSALGDSNSPDMETARCEAFETLDAIEAEILGDESGRYDWAEAQMWVALHRQVDDRAHEEAILADNLDAIENIANFPGRAMVAGIRNFRAAIAALPQT